MPNMNLTYHDISTASGQLKTGENTIHGDLGNLQKIIDGLVAHGFQTDQASGAFHDSYTQFTSGATNVISGLTGMAKYLDAVVTTMQQTDDSLAKAIRQH